MKYCTNCGAELKDNADFCLKCGVRVEKTPSEVIVTKKGLPVWAIILIAVLGVPLLITIMVWLIILFFYVAGDNIPNPSIDNYGTNAYAYSQMTMNVK